jgi:hypothetical protein
MGKVRKIGKKIGRAFKKVGRSLKKGLGKVARAFGKLGPLGSIALSFIIPGVGGWIGNLAGQQGFLGTIARGIQTAAGYVGEGVSRVFTSVTDAIGAGMNKVGSLFGKQGVGDTFQNFVSDVTGGFIKPADVQPTDQLVGMNVTPDESVIKAPKLKDQSFGEAAKARGERMFAIERPSIVKPGEINPKTGLPYEGFTEKVRASREYAAFKAVAPIREVGATMLEEDAAERFALAQARKQRSDYFSSLGQETLLRPLDPRVSFINFNNPNPTDEDIYSLNNAYGLILS